MLEPSHPLTVDTTWNGRHCSAFWLVSCSCLHPLSFIIRQVTKDTFYRSIMSRLLGMVPVCFCTHPTPWAPIFCCSFAPLLLKLVKLYTTWKLIPSSCGCNFRILLKRHNTGRFSAPVGSNSKEKEETNK